MSNFNNRPEKRHLDFKAIVQGLMSSNRSAFFLALYQAMMEHPTYVILSEMPVDRKISVLNDMLSFYEGQEDYEKCANILKLQKEVK